MNHSKHFPADPKSVVEKKQLQGVGLYALKLQILRLRFVVERGGFLPKTKHDGLRT